MTVPENPPEPARTPPGASAGEWDGPAPEVAEAPPVVVVLVAHDPGWWFEETLSSVAAQRYPQTSVLVVDNASADPEALRDRVAAVLPTAHLRRLETDAGFGAAANEALRAVQGASFLLLCHDDVRLAPDVVQIMVEEAFRSNAGVVGPKIVDWYDPRRLLQVGMGADRYGEPSPYVERGDLDQSQHDAVRDSFYVPGAATLVRADLFAALDGFDPEITFHGDDLDLGWRARVAGARVVVAPAARVGHLEALGVRRAVDDRRRLQARHRLRVVRVADTLGTRLRTVPVAFLLALVEVLHAAVFGRFRHVRDIAAAWTWNLRHAGGTRRRRRQLATARQVPDRDVRAFQVRRSARLSAYLRGDAGRERAAGARDVVSNLRESRTLTTIIVWTLVAVFLLVGSRGLLVGPLPAIGQLAPFDDVGQLLSRWASGFHADGLGSTAPNATGLGVYGGLGVVVFGATSSRRGALVAVVVYAAVPVGTNALSTGRWAGIVAYGLSPWLLVVLAGSSHLAPFGSLGGSPGPGVRRRPVLTRIVGGGLLVALGATVDPSLLVLLPVCGLGLVVGGLLAGQVAGAGRLVLTTVGGTVVALVLHLPWSLAFLDGWSAIVAPTSTAGRGMDLSAVLRFDTGPFGGGVTGLFLLLAALLPLLIGRRWRLGWAVRMWALAVVGFAAAWADGQGWWSFDLPAPEVLLAPAAVGLAVATALGMVAFEVDLPDYHFGWRQIVSLLAGVAVVVTVVPAWASVVSGRWELPRGDFTRSLAFMREEAEAEPFRALWLGDAGVLPGVGWKLDAPGVDDLGPDRVLALLTTEEGVPRVSGNWPGAEGEATPRVADAVASAAAGGTSRLGALLAPMGVRYVVVPLGPAPDPFAEQRRYEPADLLAVLEGQLDLDGVTVNPGVRVYRNAAWGPARAVLPPGTEPGPEDGPATLPELVGAPVALPGGDGVTDHEGVLDAPSTVFLASAGGERWSLEVAGGEVPRRDAFGWASSFAVTEPGDARLAFSTPATRWLALLGQVALWVLAVLYLLRVRVVEDERDTIASSPEAGAPLADPHVVLTADDADGSLPVDAPTMAVPVIVDVVPVDPVPVDPVPVDPPLGDPPPGDAPPGDASPTDSAPSGRSRRGRRTRGKYAR